ncbi:MAG TPA: UDP-2,3-diacylglucosamine diphosphatase [Gammaproteobacteria bacterium]|nr:UDP-2,3-diacylglucosamine diphosphatase [Gammaproteobacteria bacterium]
MSHFFIADLHLEEARPALTALFLKFLKEEARTAKALYILGDLFEVWIGDDDNSKFNQAIIAALRQKANQGTALYFIRGNRDFLIGKRFQREAACQILPDEYRLIQNGQVTLLMHGDTLCTQDEKYLRFRKKSRNFFIQKLFLLKSLRKRKALAEKARKLSYEHTQQVASPIMDVTQSEVERLMLKHETLHLIHGHTHRPAVHRFLLAGQEATRTVLAPWHEKGSALVYHGDGKREFIEFT